MLIQDPIRGLGYASADCLEEMAAGHPPAGANGPGREYIKIELYNSPTVNNVPSSNASLVSWSPLPCVAGGQLSYDAG